MIMQGKKVRIKCPVCGRTTVNLNRLTIKHKFLRYECYKCEIVFTVEKGWRRKMVVRK